MSEASAVTFPQQVEPTASPAIDGFPYLVTRIVASLHHMLLLPRSWGIEPLIDFSARQVLANRLPTCLVLAQDLCAYWGEDGSVCRSSDIPRGARLVSGRIRPVQPLPDSTNLAIRRMKLILFEEAQNRGPETTIVMGDLTKGGRLPTDEEEEKLRGTHAGNVPRGLLPCPQCGEWRGECFDTLFSELVVRVHCSCENDNRCAACGELLGGRKLNANYFNPEDGKIWHLPAFGALDHRCPG